jgi:hypothetical protein
MLFASRLGFSGTPSDLLPIELGHCHYEVGTDGKIIHVLNSPRIVSTRFIDAGWSPKSVSNEC